MADTTVRLNCDDEIISDETLETMLDALHSNETDEKTVAELLQAMNENRIISREEAEHILEVEGPNKVIKCGLPPTVRPTDPENTTDPEECVSRLLKNDPSLTEINLNNMKRTPIPVIQRMLMALKENTHLKKLMLANTALTDAGAEPLLDSLQYNTTLETLNVETNFLSGDFLARLFKAALTNQTLREIKAVNQSPTFSTEAEMEIMHAVNTNRGLTKVSVNLRHPEAKNKVEQACLRNGEIRRQLRRLEQLQLKEETQKPQTDGIVQNDVEKQKPAIKETAAPKTTPTPKPAAKVEDKKAEKQPEKPSEPAAKKVWTRKVEEKPSAPSSVKKDQNAVDTKIIDKKLVKEEKKPEKEEKKIEEKKPIEKEKPVLKKDIGKTAEEKPVAAKNAVPPPPPPTPKEDTTKNEVTTTSDKPAQPKPTLTMVAKEAAIKAASRGFGTSQTSDATPKKKISIGEKPKPVEDVKPIDTSMPLERKTSVTRPGSLNVGPTKEIPTSKGLGAATFGSSTAPKPPTPSSKVEPPKGRRGSGTVKPPTPATPTPKTETTTKPWGTNLKSVSSAKSSDAKSKADADAKTKTYGYGSGGLKKRDSINK